jgi:hypothetical protein
MGVHVVAPPALHTCVRLRGSTMRPSPSRARVGTSASMYSQRTRHVEIYISIDAKSGHVYGYACAFVHTRAIACGRCRCADTRHVCECDALTS